PQPASSDFRYLFDPRNVSGGVSQFFQDVRLNTVQCPQHHVFSALINDSQNCNRNQQSDNGICFCESEVNSYCTEQHRETCPSIITSVIPVCNERRTPNLFTHFDSENCYGLISDETSQRCCNNGSKVSDEFRMDQSANGLVSRH